MKAEEVITGRPSARDLLFYLILLIFISHNFGQVFTLLTGRQPSIKSECPLSLAFAQTPLVFDRDAAFFDRSEVTLIYAGERKTFRVLEALRKFETFPVLNGFTRWPNYVGRPEIPHTLLRHYFCEYSPIYTRVAPPNNQLPISVEWDVSSPLRNKNLFHSEVQCRH
ncbi:MAG: hypothetical protein ACXVB9_07175 [Bdellovibrionota bacterium]